MAKEKSAGSAKRYGVRYGARNRRKAGMAEQFSKEMQKCPYCHYAGVSRVSAGVWFCKKCGAKFSGKAYGFKIKPEKITGIVTAEEAVAGEDVEEEKEEALPEEGL